MKGLQGCECVFVGSLLLSWDIPFRGCTERRNRERGGNRNIHLRSNLAITKTLMMSLAAVVMMIMT